MNSFPHSLQVDVSVYVFGLVIFIFHSLNSLIHYSLIDK